MSTPSDFSKKMRLFYVPFTLASIGAILLFVLLFWLLYIKTHFLQMKQIEFGMLLDMAISLSIGMFWFKPKLDVLKNKLLWMEGNGLLIVMPTMMMLVTSMILMVYMQTAFGTISKLDNINQIDSLKTTQYYYLKHYYLDKDAAATSLTYGYSGRYNDFFDMHLFIAVPIYEQANDTSAQFCKAWWGVEYSKSILHGNMDSAVLQFEFDRFADSCYTKFQKDSLQPFVYLSRVLPSTEENDGFNLAITNNSKYSPQYANVLLPINKPYSQKDDNNLLFAIEIFVGSNLIWLLLLANAKFDEGKQLEIRKEKQEPKKKSDIWRHLIPNKQLLITPFLIYANIGVFVVLLFKGENLFFIKAHTLIPWGANYAPYTTHGQWWRLVTNIFLTQDMWEAVMGCCFIGIVAGVVEPIVGRIRLILIYMVAGIMGSLVSVYWHPADIHFGAAGAVFGLMGAYLALMLTKAYYDEALSGAYLAGILFVLIMDFIFSAAGYADGSLHFGGLVSGFLIGLMISPAIKKRNNVAKKSISSEEIPFK